jgi:hypothetical protein
MRVLLSRWSRRKNGEGVGTFEPLVEKKEWRGCVWVLLSHWSRRKNGERRAEGQGGHREAKKGTQL